MGFWEFYEGIEKIFMKALDSYILYGIAIFLVIGAFIGGVIFLLFSLVSHPDPVLDPKNVFIEANALEYCKNLSFNAWRYKNNSDYQFECFYREEDNLTIEKFFNMSEIPPI